jgi:hypothetical protein
MVGVPESKALNLSLSDDEDALDAGVGFDPNMSTEPQPASRSSARMTPISAARVVPKACMSPVP